MLFKLDYFINYVCMKTGAEKAANAVFAKVLDDVKPTAKELEDSVYSINQLTTRLKKIVPKDVEIRVVGSVVRGTQLRGESDVDVFLLFPKKYPRNRITRDGLEYAKRIAKENGNKCEVKYAQHPYARLFVRSLGIRADIVPAFAIDNIEDMSTAVDRSPMHADFINKHLSTRQRDEVRLLKYLLKRQRLYGAEVRTSGFSGYLCELLVYHYGSLNRLLESTASFTLPILLDPKGKAVLRDAGLVKRFNSQFAVIDPIDRNRNVAAGVSMETLARFVLLCRAFVRKPDVRFFYGRGFSSAKVGTLLSGFLKDAGLDMYVIASNIPDKSEDVVWPQLRKVSGIIEHQAEKLGFSIYLTLPVIVGKKGLMAFFAPKEVLRTRMQKGPSVFIGKAQEAFMKAHKDSVGMTVRGESLYALEKNRYESVAHLMKDMAAGKMLSRRKDVALRGSMLFVNKLPLKYAEAVYSELAYAIRL